MIQGNNASPFSNITNQVAVASPLTK